MNESCLGESGMAKHGRSNWLRATTATLIPTSLSEQLARLLCPKGNSHILPLPPFLCQSRLSFGIILLRCCSCKSPSMVPVQLARSGSCIAALRPTISREPICKNPHAKVALVFPRSASIVSADTHKPALPIHSTRPLGNSTIGTWLFIHQLY